MNENIRLANELLRRPELMAALDRHGSTGALDGLVDRHSLNAVIQGKTTSSTRLTKSWPVNCLSILTS